MFGKQCSVFRQSKRAFFVALLWPEACVPSSQHADGNPQKQSLTLPRVSADPPPPQRNLCGPSSRLSANPSMVLLRTLCGQYPGPRYLFVSLMAASCIRVMMRWTLAEAEAKSTPTACGNPIVCKMHCCAACMQRIRRCTWGSDFSTLRTIRELSVACRGRIFQGSDFSTPRTIREPSFSAS